MLSELGKDSAFLVAEERGERFLYYSRGTEPVSRLIQGIYDSRPDQARRILRARIYTSSQPTVLEWGMLRVAAKRLSCFEPRETSRTPSGYQRIEVVPEPPPPLLAKEALSPEILKLLMKKDFSRAALAIGELIPEKPLRHESDRRVAAILVDAKDDFVAAAVNSNAKNRTRHAEMNLVQGYLALGNPALPAGSRIYVTLKCCKMCAGAIWEKAADISRLTVRYLEDDPGPNARITVFTPFSFDRKRAARNAQELALEIETRHES